MVVEDVTSRQAGRTLFSEDLFRISQENAFGAGSLGGGAYQIVQLGVTSETECVAFASGLELLLRLRHAAQGQRALRLPKPQFGEGIVNLRGGDESFRGGLGVVGILEFDALAV